MGRSDPYMHDWYKSAIRQRGKTALLGFTKNNWFEGDLYDRQLGNWEINSDWQLDQNYDTIICLRCAYFAKDPKKFITKCYEHLNPGGFLYADWGLGGHWNFDQYKIGWYKNGEHEHAYDKKNFLWSTIWHESFMQHPEMKLFEERVRKFGYEFMKKAIFDEVPSVLRIEDVHQKNFLNGFRMKSLWTEKPQLYILLEGEKKAVLNVFGEDILDEEHSDHEETALKATALIDKFDVNEDSLVIDVGCNHGIVVDVLLPTKCKIWAYEPHPMFYEQLSKKYEGEKNVKLSNAAVWDCNGIKNLYFKNSATADNGGASLILSKRNVDCDLYTEVECVDICDVIRATGQQVDILKIDAEGAEYKILDRLFESGLYTKVDNIFFEDHRKKIRNRKWLDQRLEVMRKYQSIGKDLCMW